MNELGCFLPSRGSLADKVALAVHAESLGYHSVWATHEFGHDALLLLATIAASTSSVGLGTGIVPIYPRSPVLLAQEAASLDEFSRDRLWLGLGVSHRHMMERMLGLSMGSPVDAMREYVSIVRDLLRGEMADHTGGRFSAKVKLTNPHLRTPATPLLIAALQPGMVRLAAEVADGIVLWYCPPSYVRDQLMPVLAQELERHGRDPSTFVVAAMVPLVVSDEISAAQAVARRDLTYYAQVPFYTRMLRGSGFDSEINALVERRMAGDRQGAEAAISETMLDELFGLGSRTEVAAAISRYRSAGVNLPLVRPTTGDGCAEPAQVLAAAKST